jgi:sialate O-acetylesterase
MTFRRPGLFAEATLVRLFNRGNGMRTNTACFKAPLALCVCLASGITASAADFTVAGIFADGMVIQRGVEVPVWGRGSRGAKVTVEFAGRKQSTKVAGDGKWRLNLAPLEASSAAAELKVITDGEVFVFKDVLVGDVWLCSGQSNIQRNLTEADNGVESLAKDEFPTIRFVIVPHQRAEGRQDDFKVAPGIWHPVNKSNLTVSAVGFFFARRLVQNLHVPVGLIISAWEGSVITTWAPRDGIPVALNPDKSVGLTFNAKINPMIPFAIKGVVWYQGEENHGMGMKYADYLTCMANAWRRDWGSNLPFLIVMIAPHTYEGVPEQFPSERGKLPEFWMAQLDAVRRLKNAEIACTVDVGNARNDIHPRQKEAVGERLAMAAMKLCFGESNSAPGPLFKSVDFQGGTAAVTFDHIAQGLKLTGDRGGFEIAGADRKYAPTKAALAGRDVVILKSDAVAQPAFVRYAWSNTPGWSVFNSEGLPAIPFSTEWNGTHAGVTR